ncbi:MAG TPA: hypothetical protein VJX66_11755 [Amycolatopsis sp.]|nr:hypothetical protein [Amycolatopsis sp.]
MPAQLHVAWLTNTNDAFDHAVTDDEFAHGRTHTPGQYRALCGNPVLPCSMLIPPGRPCPRCRTILVAHSMPPGPHRRPPRHHKDSVLRRLLRLFQSAPEPVAR